VWKATCGRGETALLLSGFWCQLIENKGELAKRKNTKISLLVFLFFLCVFLIAMKGSVVNAPGTSFMDEFPPAATIERVDAPFFRTESSLRNTKTKSRKQEKPKLGQKKTTLPPSSTVTTS
jgi:hypothetical protein